MAPNRRRGLFRIRHFVHTYMPNSKTKHRIRTFYLSNDNSTIEDIYFLGYSCMRDTIDELWFQARIATFFRYDICAYLHALITPKLQVVYGRSTYRTTTLLSMTSIFGVKAVCKMRLPSYDSKHTSHCLPISHLCVLTRISNDCSIIRDIPFGV